MRVLWDNLDALLVLLDPDPDQIETRFSVLERVVAMLAVLDIDVEVLFRQNLERIADALGMQRVKKELVVASSIENIDRL